MTSQGVRLLGASRQIIGAPWCRAGDFAWCGGVAARSGTAADPCRPFLEPLERFGRELAARFQPRGAVGVDCVATADGRLFVLEVNPRPTASMELHERLGAGSIAGLHVAACDTRACPQPAATGDHAAGMTSRTGPAAWAKAILFAAAPTPITEHLVALIRARRDAWTDTDGGWPAISDLPRPDQVIPGRAPVLTVFAAGDTEQEAETLLRSRIAAVVQLLPDDPDQPAIRRGTAPLAAAATKCIR
jgi:predicted ATP-grasp superfamily ATP-dependent carboligase